VRVAQNGAMRRMLLLASALATLACVTLAGCTGGAALSATHHTVPTTGPVTGPAGSPDNPLVFSCGEESFASPPPPQQAQPGDLAVGPLVIISGKKLATADPADWGEHGSYKIPIMVTMGSTVTITIDPPARGHVVINNPYAPHGVTAATYRPCRNVAGFFAQGFNFTNGQVRGCVPLEVRVGDGDEARVHRVTISLFAGSCAA
jgi:hypothetical protein